MNDASTTCAVERCPRTVDALGWCDKHYRRWKSTGSPLRPPRRCLGCDTLVGGEDDPNRKWCTDKCRTTVFRANNREALNARQNKANEGRREDRRARSAIYRKANPEKVAKAARAWERANPEKARAIRQAAGRRRKGKQNEYLAGYRRANKERIDAQIKQWRVANPERLRGYGSARRSRQYAVAHEPASIFYFYKRDKGRCGLCGGRVNMKLRRPDLMCASIDHIIPLAKGGDDTRANKQLAPPDLQYP